MIIGGASAQLLGLVLSGGLSSRMGRDKGTLEFRGEPQVQRAFSVVLEVCGRAVVSIRREQAACSPYLDIPTVADRNSAAAGPAVGLLSTWYSHPDDALLVLAADMPFVERSVLNELVRARASSAIATAYVHPDGTPEPLCTIWEPSARLELERRVAAGDSSLSRLLSDSAARLLVPSEPGRLKSVNSPDDYARVVELLSKDTL
jgi:molybdopterin-guanine dinucleotide biosynthesis protein A